MLLQCGSKQNLLHAHQHLGSSSVRPALQTQLHHTAGSALLRNGLLRCFIPNNAVSDAVLCYADAIKLQKMNQRELVELDMHPLVSIQVAAAAAIAATLGVSLLAFCYANLYCMHRYIAYKG